MYVNKVIKFVVKNTSITGVFLDWIGHVLLEEGVHDVDVELDSGHGSQDEQSSVGEHADQAVVADGDQDAEHGAEDGAGGEGVGPQVDLVETHDELKRRIYY